MRKNRNQGDRSRLSGSPGGGMTKRKQVDPNAPPPERSSFDHSRLERTPEESQKRLFSSRHRQARNKSKRDKQLRTIRTVILPVVFVSGFVLVIGLSIYKTMRSEREIETKLNKANTLGTEGGTYRRVADDSAGTIDVARDRYLMRGNDPVATANEADP